jgi:valacyclovir hydrolase
MLQKNVAERAQRTLGQIAFWQHVHGDDWPQIVDADSDLLLRFAENGGDWFKGRLQEIKCPVLFTASKQDGALPNVTQQICRMAEQVANSRVFLNDENWKALGSLVDHYGDK